MKLDDFDYHLDESRIAQCPRRPRDSSKLLVVNRENNFTHTTFRRIVDFLERGDLLVINDSKTIRARLYGKRASGGKCEILLLKKNSSSDDWEVMVKPAKKIKTNDKIFVGDAVIEVVGEGEEGIRIIKFLNKTFIDVVTKYGRVPLPPYIKREDELKDRRDYQTVYAKEGFSVAAPTAGLHFTKRVLNEIQKKGVEIRRIRLDVGPGTFKGVTSPNLDEHKMHTENYYISEESAKSINKALSENRRVIAVGTTVVRTLEDQMLRFGRILEGDYETDIFIKEPYNFRAVSGIVTNFHLPKTTLLMLVSAFKSREIIFKAYKEAMNSGYFFYSYGDAMLLMNK
jgi:S-adenosylmethionine:tRNA ribosyltransferase-isomerase